MNYEKTEEVDINTEIVKLCLGKFIKESLFEQYSELMINKLKFLINSKLTTTDVSFAYNEAKGSCDGLVSFNDDNGTDKTISFTIVNTGVITEF